MKTLKIQIDCSEKTCGTGEGKFCNYTGSTKFGTVHICLLFPSELGSSTVLQDVGGWLIRCDACLKSESV